MSMMLEAGVALAKQHQTGWQMEILAELLSFARVALPAHSRISGSSFSAFTEIAD
jgi:hypothetical protein